MKKKNMPSLTAATLLLYLACSTGTAQTVSELNAAKKAISASNELYFQSFERNDPSIFVDRYAADCMIMVPNLPAIKGLQGALAFFKTAYEKMGLRGGRFITVAVYGLGDDYVAEEGLWESFDESKKIFDEGKFLVLWKKTSRGWKMFRDSFSSNGRPH